MKLPDFNGIELIKKINSLNIIKSPSIIIISGEISLISEFKIKHSICNIIHKSESIEHIYNKVKEIINELNYLNFENNIKDEILSELSDLGYSLKYKGTHYILESIIYIYRNNNLDLLDNLEKNVYKYIAFKNNKTINNIKTNIIKSTSLISKNINITPKLVISNVLIKLTNTYNLY